METDDAVAALSALAHPGRLAIFRLLVKAGNSGLPAGEIARRTNSRANTLSSNLAILTHAGLAASRREGRSIIYTAGYARMGDLLSFLIKDCCADDPAICGPVVERARACG